MWVRGGDNISNFRWEEVDESWVMSVAGEAGDLGFCRKGGERGVVEVF